MEFIGLSSLVISLIGFITSVLARKALTSEKIAPFTILLKQIERVLSGKPLSIEPLEVQLDEAVRQLNEATGRVGNIMDEIRSDIETKRKEAVNLRTTIDELRKEYQESKSLANLTIEEADAVRQLLTKEVSKLKRKSYLPDILINFGVGAFFFVLGLFISQIFGM